MSILAAIGNAVSSLPSICNNINCSNTNINCCSNNKSECTSILKHQDITNRYVSANDYTKFEVYNKGIILQFTNSQSSLIDDMSWACTFAKITFQSKLPKRPSIKRMIIDQHYMVVEYQPPNWRGRSSGIIIRVREDEWRSFAIEA